MVKPVGLSLFWVVGCMLSTPLENLKDNKTKTGFSSWSCCRVVLGGREG